MRSNWGEDVVRIKRFSALIKQKLTLKEKNRTQINGKCNNISNAEENK
jgi:hypothetical protein